MLTITCGNVASAQMTSTAVIDSLGGSTRGTRPGKAMARMERKRDRPYQGATECCDSSQPPTATDSNNPVNAGKADSKPTSKFEAPSRARNTARNGTAALASATPVPSSCTMRKLCRWTAEIPGGAPGQRSRLSRNTVGGRSDLFEEGGVDHEGGGAVLVRARRRA